MSDKQIEKIIAETSHSFAIEGLTVDTDCVDLCKKVLREEMTVEQFVERVKEIYGAAV